MIGLLLKPALRHLFVAQACSLIGSGIATFTLGLLAYDMDGVNAGQVLGTALTVRMLAFAFVSPVAGALLSSLPRRTCLVVLDLMRAAIVVALPFAATLWQVYLLVFVQQACAAAHNPIFQSVFPDILENEKQYTQALSISRLAYELEAFMSPALAAAMLTLIPFRFLFWGASLSFVAAALMVMTATLPAVKPSTGVVGVFARLKRGLQLYFKTPRLRGLLALSLASAAAGAMVIINTVVYVRDYLIGTNQGVAELLTAYGIGSIAVAIILPRILDVVRDRTVMLVGALLAAGLLALSSVGPGFQVALGVWLAYGMSKAAIITPAGRLLARSAFDRDRPAIYATHFSLSHVCWLFTYPLAGWGGATWGLHTTFELMAAIAAIGTVVAFFVWPHDDSGITLESLVSTEIEASEAEAAAHSPDMDLPDTSPSAESGYRSQ